MKIAIVNVTAVTGSTGKIAHGLKERLTNDGNDVRLYYGRIDRTNDRDTIRISSDLDTRIHALLARITGLQGYFSKRATLRLIRELDRWKPDIVQLFNLHGYYLNINMFLRYLRDSGIKTVYSMLDEFPYLGRCCYSFECDGFKTGCKACKLSKKEYPKTWSFRFSRKYFNDKKATYSGFNNICFVAPQWVVERAQSSALLKGTDCRIVDEYVDTEQLFYPRDNYKYLDEELVNDKRIIILTVAPYSNERKGGKFFIEAAKRMEDKEDYLFLYVGMNVKGIDCPKNCSFKGFVSNQKELAEYYSIADVFVCTSQADTMPNVCLDAMSCGTPVIGFNNTGIPYVADRPYGVFVENQNVSELVKEIEKIVKKTKTTEGACRKYAENRYSPEVYYKKMKDIYMELMSK